MTTEPGRGSSASMAPAIAQAAGIPAVASGRLRAGSLLQRTVFALLLGAATFVFLFPFVWLLSASLKTRATVFDMTLFEQPLQFSNYQQVFDIAPVASWFFNSVVVGLLSAATVTVSSALVAFGFAYFRFRFREPLFGLVLASMMLPGAVTMIPNFLIWNALGQVNTLTPLWAGNLFASAFYIFLLRQFYLSLPRELFEAARVDGASYPRMWWSIAVPLTKAALIVVFIFELKASWTDLVKPLIFLRDPALFTLPRGLKQLVDLFNPVAGGQGEFQLVMAATVLVVLPMIVVFFLGQRYFVEGIATTGSKG
jgi:multiple sugar transport system permease protein